MEYREIFLTLLRKFETKQPCSFLRDLVESTHLFLRMLERFCKGRNNLVVQKKRAKRKKSKGRKNLTAAETTPEALEETWRAVTEELRVTGFKLSEALTEGAVPFNAVSDTPLEEQRTEAMVRVQDALFNRLGPEALGLLRAVSALDPRPPPPEPGMEEDEELESVRVSETEFNFLDFIKR
ncbi:unnamed protein product [Coregonus sp. 'balchen']|nr:unnamed protein product [Coregonus sp. 'balchen']